MTKSVSPTESRLSPRVAVVLVGAVLVAVTACLSVTFAQDVRLVPLPPERMTGVTDDKPLATEADNTAEFRAFNEIVRAVRTISPQLFADSVTPGVTGRQLYEDERKSYRGSVVRVTGQLKRLQKI